MFKFGNIVFWTRPYAPSLWNTTPKQQRHTQCASWKLDVQGHYVIRAYSIPESFSLRPQMLFWPSRFWSPLFLIWFLYVELHLQPLCVVSECREAVRLHSDQTQRKHRFFHRFQYGPSVFAAVGWGFFSPKTGSKKCSWPCQRSWDQFSL